MADVANILIICVLQVDATLGQPGFHGGHARPAGEGHFVLQRTQHDFASLCASSKSGAHDADQVQHAVVWSVKSLTA